MLKRLLIGFVAVDLAVVAALVVVGLTADADPVVWWLAAIWAVAAVLVPLVAVRPLLARSAGGPQRPA